MATRLPLDPRGFHQPRFSPDGTRVAVTVGEGRSGVDGDVWVYSFATETLNRLTFDGNGLYPVWSRDGERIGFLSYLVNPSVLLRSADGRGSVTTYIEGEVSPIFPESFSPTAPPSPTPRSVRAPTFFSSARVVSRDFSRRTRAVPSSRPTAVGSRTPHPGRAPRASSSVRSRVTESGRFRPNSAATRGGPAMVGSFSTSTSGPPKRPLMEVRCRGWRRLPGRRARGWSSRISAAGS